ncbi:hypothetical protein [Paenibacillus pinistramenti]|uniref:hypothetical protein n=1 Tax=Paenibacillus pinistramenti TaxID=1768003 RepID=UPI0011087BDB|nr:hypothetical protein [Paenibacillus pinistramenti]
MSKKAVNVILFILSGLPLLAYPLVLIANLMQVAGDAAGADFYKLIVVYLFVFLSTTYILTYLISLIVHLVRRNKQRLTSVIPVVHLALTVIVFLLWMLAD